MQLVLSVDSYRKNRKKVVVVGGGEVSSLMFVDPAALRVLCLLVLAALRLPVGLMLCRSLAAKPSY